MPWSNRNNTVHISFPGFMVMGEKVYSNTGFIGAFLVAMAVCFEICHHMDGQ